MSLSQDRYPPSVDGQREVTLLELLDRLLDSGVVLRGQITIAVADVDLIELDLALMLASAERVSRLLWPHGPGEQGAEPTS